RQAAPSRKVRLRVCPRNNSAADGDRRQDFLSAVTVGLGAPLETETARLKVRQGDGQAVPWILQALQGEVVAIDRREVCPVVIGIGIDGVRDEVNRAVRE